jgi:hypothetical protein
MIAGVGLVVLGLILAAIPIVKLIHWAIDGGVDVGLVIIAIFLYIALLASVMAGPSIVKVAALLLILVSAVAMPVLGGAAAQVEMKQMDDERIHSYAAALERNPMDPVARIALAQELEKRGDLDQAIEHLEWVLKEFPRLAFQHQRTLDTWKRERERQGVPDIFFCHVCHAEQAPGTRQCTQCGALFGTAEAMRQRFLVEGGPKTIIKAWVILTVAIGVAMFVVLELPSIVAGPIIIATLIVGAVVFLRWVGGDLGKPAD